MTGTKEVTYTKDDALRDAHTLWLHAEPAGEGHVSYSYERNRLTAYIETQDAEIADLKSEVGDKSRVGHAVADAWRDEAESLRSRLEAAERVAEAATIPATEINIHGELLWPRLDAALTAWQAVKGGAKTPLTPLEEGIEKYGTDYKDYKDEIVGGTK